MIELKSRETKERKMTVQLPPTLQSLCDSNRQENIRETSISAQFRFQRCVIGEKKNSTRIQSHEHKLKRINQRSLLNCDSIHHSKHILLSFLPPPFVEFKGKISPALNSRNCSKAGGTRGIISRSGTRKPTRTRR